jgi:C-terminal processing protease CtpA/Prc
MIRVRSVLLAVSLIAPLQPARGQPLPATQPPDFTITAAERTSVIEELGRRLDQAYVFPAKATETNAALRKHASAGVYDTITSGQRFADLLTRHLQAVTNDKHLRVRVAPANGGARPAPPTREQQLEAARAANYGFGRAEILPGNIGYLEIRGFGSWVPEARDTVARILSTLADADALIIDLRANGGGSPQAVAFVSSYLFGDEPVHLNSLYFRPANQTDDFYTDPSVPGRKFGPTKPVYVLTSNRTFSAAEEFTYNLQSRKRATIVGETTGGGAHPGGMVPIGSRLVAFIPSGRAINPITKTNWEGVGVKPEIAVPPEKALEVALDAARRKAIHPDLQH